MNSILLVPHREILKEHAFGNNKQIIVQKNIHPFVTPKAKVCVVTVVWSSQLRNIAELVTTQDLREKDTGQFVDYSTPLPSSLPLFKNLELHFSCRK